MAEENEIWLRKKKKKYKFHFFYDFLLLAD